MLLIQQSISFRAWTSRALMVYFRRALLFLVISPYQNINNHLSVSQQQQQTVYFSDAEDDDDILMIEELFFDQDIKNINRLELQKSNYNLSKKLSRGLNNSMIKSIDESYSSIPSSVTERFELFSDNSKQRLKLFVTKTENNLSDVSANQYQQTSANYYNQIQTLQPYSSHFDSTNSLPSYPSCLPSVPLYHSSNKELPSIESFVSKTLEQCSLSSFQKNLFCTSDNEDNIYEKYQNSFSHLLHQTKSLYTIDKQDQLESVLVIEPNTSFITVRQLTYHPFNPNTINSLMITSHVCVRLIANQIDSSVQCDTKHNQQQSVASLNRQLQDTSILIDLPHKILYIDL